VPLTDISLLFKDIIETPQQKQQRLFAEGQAAAGQFTGLPTGLRELAMGTASGIPNMVESVRQFGATAGLPVQTQGEQMQGAMANFNIDDPNSRIAVLNQLRAIDPMRAVAFGEMLKERDAAETERKLMEDFREREMKVAEARLTVSERQASVSERQADTAAEELTFRNTQQEDLQDWRDIQDKNTDLDRELERENIRVKERLADLQRDELGSRAVAFTNELSQETDKLLADGAAAQNLAIEFEVNAENIDAGALARIGERWKAFTGDQERVSALRTQFNRIKNSAALDGLPPGAASDKDIDMAMSGFPDEFWPPEQIAQWLRGVEKMSFIAAEKANEHLKFVVENGGQSAMVDPATGNAVTFNDVWREKVNENGGKTFIETLELKYGSQGLNILSVEEMVVINAEAQAAANLEAENQRRAAEQRAQEESEDEALRRLGRQFTPGA